ncbi:helix-turn-helix transcriptional regulator [Chelativorans intermedius]|uniref:PAS domain-containing protein n=1 Tax=Chelativorans intermedius TaxID=515947 RepID=A0ABV6D3F9_9HYPH|nr:PAS domain-containing protein [Chelativorans intermedius]MCT8998341.1 PAS domain-containing protein [Chelativorans intermedius]
MELGWRNDPAAFPAPLASALDQLYCAAFEPALWHDGLERFCKALGACAAVTFPRIVPEHTLFLPYTEEMGEFLQAFVKEEWHKRDLRAERGWPLVDAGCPVLLEQDIITPEDHRREALYQDFSLRYGLLWWAGITFESLERQYALALYRRDDEEPFCEDDRRLFLRLRSSLSRALTMAEQVATLAGRGGLEALESLDRGGILVDARGRVIALNRRAERLLGDVISVVHGRLAARNPEDDRALQILIGQTLLHGPREEGGVILRRMLRRPVCVDALPVPADAGPPFLFGRALLVFIDLEGRPVPRDHVLMHLFRLTRSETALCVELASGRTLAKAAERLRITAGTARQRLKDIFHKTGTHRQSELVALLSRLPGSDRNGADF